MYLYLKHPIHKEGEREGEGVEWCREYFYSSHSLEVLAPLFFVFVFSIRARFDI